MEPKPVRYHEILFPEEEPFSWYTARSSGIERVLGPLSHINIFVGTNNSGKSHLLRGLFAHKDFDFATDRFNIQTLLDRLDLVRSKFEELLQDGAVKQITAEGHGSINGKFFENIIAIAREHFLGSPGRLKRIIEQLTVLDRIIVHRKSTSEELKHSSRDRESSFKSDVLKPLLRFVDNEQPKPIYEERYYVPILRGMKALEGRVPRLRSIERPIPISTCHGCVSRVFDDNKTFRRCANQSKIHIQSHG